MKKLFVCMTGLLLCSTLWYPVSASATQQSSVQVLEATAQEEETTMYGIGSVSKVFTTAAAMKLVEQGKLDLDRALTNYIPEFTMADARYTQITPRMLLNHSAGLMGMTDNNAQLLGDHDTYNHDNFLAFLSAQKLKHAPGETSIYCNDGFTLAEILIERVSGMDFTEYLEQTFFAPLGITHIKSPQSEFDRALLAPIYVGDSEMQHESFEVIGSGGLYASMEDLCKFATLFMDASDGSILSKESVLEMNKDQHQNPVTNLDRDDTERYGLGWDSVNTYPFYEYGIRALHKGGGTGRYHTSFMVVPEHNLAVGVASSGEDSNERLVAQEILLEVLREEGLLEAQDLALPAYDTSAVQVPEEIKRYAGCYDMGQGFLMQLEFTDTTLVITPIGVRNERAQTYVYNQDGKFVNKDGDYIGLGSLATARKGIRGVTEITFAKDRYLLVNTYESYPGLSQLAYSVPIAEKVTQDVVADAATQAWQSRNDKEYLLVSETHSSMQYVNAALAKIYTDARTPGYVGVGVYRGGGKNIKSARIVDGAYAQPYQSTPNMMGRDTNALQVQTVDGIETLFINNYTYIDAASIADSTQMGDGVRIGAQGAVWFALNQQTQGKSIRITTPENGSWFIYDEKMQYVASSLEKTPRALVVLPKEGRMVFVGTPDSTFSLQT